VGLRWGGTAGVEVVTDRRGHRCPVCSTPSPHKAREISVFFPLHVLGH